MKKTTKKEQIIKLLEQGLRKAEVTRRTGCHFTYVYQVARQLEKRKQVKTPNQVPAPTPHDPNTIQIGGVHYKLKQIQPWDAIVDWQLGFLDGNVVKYVARWKTKDGVQDLKKARHYLDKLIASEEGK